MVHIERDYDKGREMWHAVEGHVEGDTNRRNLEVHCSDLLWCVRQSWFKKMRKKRLTVDEILKFFRGKISEYTIGRFAFEQKHYVEQKRIEGPNGIVAHPDIVSDEEDLVVELKQTDKRTGFTDPRQKTYNSFVSYATQLLYYMYLAGKKNGMIIVMHAAYDDIIKLILRKISGEIKFYDENPFRVWRLKMEVGDRETIAADMDFKKELLEKGIEKNNVAFLPRLITIDPNDTSKCNKCAYRQECDNSPDYWERLKRERILASRTDIGRSLIQTPDFEEFRKKYSEEDTPKTNVNYLFRTMNIQYGDLGPYYNTEVGKRHLDV